MKNSSPFFTSLILVISIVLGIAASVNASEPLGKDASVPVGLSWLDTDSRSVSLDDIKGENGTILLFTRSVDWCQYCKTQLRDWNEHIGEVKEKGYNVAAISYDKPADLKSFADNNAIQYRLLSDENASSIKAFGILNAKFTQGSRFYGIPNPAIYVIGADDKITAVFREESYKERPAVQEVLEAL